MSASTADAAESCSIISSKLISIRLNSNSVGSANIYVFMNDDLHVLEASPPPLTIHPAPLLSSFFPSSGYVGSCITILGSNFAVDSSCFASVQLTGSSGV